MAHKHYLNTKAIQIPKPFMFLLTDKCRYKVLYGGRGGAKSHNIARALLVIGAQKQTRIICGREIQKSIKDSVHALLADLIRHHGLADFYQVLKDEIRGINGTQFKFRGLKHNTADIKSLEGCDILWIEEAENVSDNTYEVVIPTIRKDKSEIWISFNPKNLTDPTYRRFVTNPPQDIVCKKVSWRDNPFFPEVLTQERLRLQKEDKEAYDHVWEGAPDVRRSGAIFAKTIAKARDEGRICKVPYDPDYEVFTAWDLGFGDATAIWWVQFVGRELRWLEYYENSGELMDHYVKIVKSKPYNYMLNGHYIPHDGANGNLQGSAVAKLNSLGIKCTVLKRSVNIITELDDVNTLIASSVFDEDKTRDGVFALEHYHRKWDDNRGRFKEAPYHDWSSHASDAARYVTAAAKLIKHINFTPKVDQSQYINRHVDWMS